MVEISPQFNKDRLDLSSQVPLATPLVVYVEPSSYCNLECKFCPQHIEPDSLVKKYVVGNVPQTHRRFVQVSI